MPILNPNSSAATATLNTDGDVSASSSTTFTMKLISMDLNIATPMVDATPEPLDSGSDPSTTSYPAVRLRHSGRTTGTVRLSGLIIEGQAFGFSSLPAEDVDVFVVIGKEQSGDAPKTHSLKFRIAVTDVRLQWARSGAGVPIVVTGQIHSGYNATVVSNTGEGVTEVVSA